MYLHEGVSEENHNTDGVDGHYYGHTAGTFC